MREVIKAFAVMAVIVCAACGFAMIWLPNTGDTVFKVFVSAVVVFLAACGVGMALDINRRNDGTS